MALDEFLLQILVCPENHEPVTVADAMLVGQLNDLVKRGRLKNRVGDVVKERLDTALVRGDGCYAYPVRDDIPVMLIDEAIPLEQLKP